MCMSTALQKPIKGHRKMTNTLFADANPVGRKDVNTKVTERIISDLARGIRPADETLERGTRRRTHHQTATP
jgi:hypothetical protein